MAVGEGGGGRSLKLKERQNGELSHSPNRVSAAFITEMRFIYKNRNISTVSRSVHNISLDNLPAYQ